MPRASKRTYGRELYDLSAGNRSKCGKKLILFGKIAISKKVSISLGRHDLSAPQSLFFCEKFFALPLFETKLQKLDGKFLVT
jgi:hypothetical protein